MLIAGLLACPLAVCLALLSEGVCKMNLWRVVDLWLAISRIPSLKQQPFLMPRDFVGEEFRAGSAAQLFCAMWCGLRSLVVSGWQMGWFGLKGLETASLKSLAPQWEMEGRLGSAGS